MHSDDESLEEDTISMGLNPHKTGRMPQPQPPRFQTIAKKLYTSPSPRDYKPPLTPIATYKQTEESPQMSILRPRVIVLNEQQYILRCQVVVASKGVCYILKMKDRWINLSWLHSIKRIEKTKLLLLYYHMSPVVKDKKPTLQPQLLQFRQREELEEFYACLLAIHTDTHDEEIEKLYHKLI